MKIKQIAYILLLIMSLGNYAIAKSNNFSNLNIEREQVVHQYILDLGNAAYQQISALFEKNGTVVSTSRGNINAKDFFFEFLPNVKSAATQLHQIFIGNSDNNRYVARFHFNFKLKNGEAGDGEYIDEFLFAENSTKLVSVYMFENLKFNINN